MTQDNQTEQKAGGEQEHPLQTAFNELRALRNQYSLDWEVNDKLVDLICKTHRVAYDMGFDKAVAIYTDKTI